MSQTRLERGERSLSRFAGVTRVGLRVVVVAGFAGVAWALSATAANAAAVPPTASAATDTQGAPLSSLVSLVNNVGTHTLHNVLGPGSAPAAHAAKHARAHGSGSESITDAVAGPVGEVLTSDVTPLLSTGGGLLSEVLAPTQPVLFRGSAGHSSTAGPQHASAAPSATSSPGPASAWADVHIRPDSAGFNDETGAGSTDLVRTVANLVAPLGLSQVLQPTLDELQPMIGVLDPLTAPFDQLLNSVAGVTTPIFDEVSAVTKPVVEILTRSTDGVATLDVGLVGDQAATATPDRPAAALAVEQMMLTAAPVRVDDDTPAQRAIVRHETRGAPALGSAHPGSDPDNIPAGQVPLPAPALGGISTTASGSHEDNGGFAILSTTVMRAVGIQLRFSRATGFAVRRLIVENPTVSPD
jgi:hypothetical protein